MSMSSGVENIPTLSGAMDRRIRLLNSSVGMMERLQERFDKTDLSLLPRDQALDLYKILSHQFMEVLEACRRCSADELVGRLENLRLYQMIQNLNPEEKARLQVALANMTRVQKAGAVVDILPEPVVPAPVEVTPVEVSLGPVVVPSAGTEAADGQPSSPL